MEIIYQQNIQDMKAKTILLPLLLLAILSQCALRFRDDQMLKSHHSQAYNGPPLTIHLIPHSHDDVGWLKTVDNYYYGGDMRTQFAGVQYTIDTVVQEMSEHPEYKFSIVQMAFLYRWWKQADDGEKDKMKKLVQNGQLAFINGGWCMSDQAGMYYEDFVDQMAVGLRWLKDTLNYVPDTAWHIDPFGHHSSSASLFSRMGFQSFFFARIDYQDKSKRLNEKSLEMIWRPYQYTESPQTSIFTHVNYYHYSPVPGFCFDDVCRDDPIKDDADLQQYNVKQKSDKFVDYFKSMANHFRTTNLMHTMGEDFTYSNARMWYKNIDKLMKYINARQSDYNVKIIYSTPPQYIKSIQTQNVSYPTKNDDFFPYADNQHSMWTGYFCSRVALKGIVRDFGRFTQVVRKYLAELRIGGDSGFVKGNTQLIEDNIFGLEMALGILQHHDAVAGTAKQKVTNDYIETGLRSINSLNDKILRPILTEQISQDISETISTADFYFNIYWNETSKVTGLADKLMGNKTVLVTLMNSGSQGNYQVKIRVPAKELNVVSIKNQKISGDVLCNNVKDTSDCELVFWMDLAESSVGYVKLVPVSTGGSAKIVPLKELTIVEQTKTFALGSDSIRITKGNQQFELKINGVTEKFQIGYNYYQGYQGEGQKSGAYIFRPAEQSSRQYATNKKIHYADGTHTVCIIIQSDKVTAKTTFSKKQNQVRNYGFQVESLIGSISILDNIGKQITMNLITSYKNNNTFYTDSMGLEQQQRILNYRPTWNYTVNEQVSGNYYPINSHIRIQDGASARNLAVLTDRSQGGTVLRDGEIEIMIHRRLLHDDGRGVEEPLNETEGGQGINQAVRHWVVFEGDYRITQKRNDQKLQLVFAQSNKQTFAKQTQKQASIAVPQKVKLFLRPYPDGSYLMRLHNIDTTKSTQVSLNEEWKMTELTLAANQDLSEWKSKQYKWKEDGKENFYEQKNIKRNLMRFEEKDRSNTIGLKAFEIKTFRISKD